MKKVILVYGWYNQGNLGDNLFVESFNFLFPDYQFLFSNEIEVSHLSNIDAVFFGGGSFLDQDPKISTAALNLIKQKNIFYIGVGLETEISNIHYDLMKRAKLIATRSKQHLDKALLLNNNSIYIPDLSFALQKIYKKTTRNNNKVLILPNISVVPTWNEPYWKHIAWESFKIEFAQFLDDLVELGKKIDFFPMCKNNYLNDAWAAVEIFNKMNKRHKIKLFFENNLNYDSMINLIQQYDIVISQRFHGIILSEMSQVPYISLYHHDKLKNVNFDRGQQISYYEISKSVLHEKFRDINNLNLPVLEENSDKFEKLKQIVKDFMDN